MAPKICSVLTFRLDIPLKEPIRMSFGVVRTQTIVVVRLRDTDGVEGVGEASLMGGPYWGSESAESVQATIDAYLAPVLLGAVLESVEGASGLLARSVRGNAAARGAVEMAAIDLLGKRWGVSAGHLLGGPCRRTLPLTWTLSTGDVASDIAEGERALAQEGYRRFKLKLTGDAAAADVDRAVAVLEAFRGRATVIADVNQGWDEVTASRFLPILCEAGLEGIEQPLLGCDLSGAARLRSGLGMELIADEALSGAESAFQIAAAGAASVFSLKPNRDGGLAASKRVAAVASAAGLGVYGGSMLETSLGSAACAHLYASVPELRLGCELFGPFRLAEDIVVEPLRVVDGALILPDGPGLGVTLDEDRIGFLGRRYGVGASLESAA